MTYENSCPPSLEDGLSPIPWQSPPLPALSVEDRLRLMLAVSASRHAESALLQCLSRLESDDQRRQATLIARAQARLSALLGEAARLPNGCAAMLTAAALTYVAALATSAMTILRFLLIIGDSDRRRR